MLGFVFIYNSLKYRQTLPIYYSTARPLSSLFIIIGILIIEHNYCLGLFFYFLDVPQNKVALPLYSFTARPLPPLFIVIEILKFEYDYQWGLFFYFLEVPATALIDCFTAYPSSFISIVIRILFGVLLTVFICRINRYHSTPL